tara:strand:+ start:264 stop:434 length:171 start_codon:yes stop_codon:yes gene_type:complete
MIGILGLLYSLSGLMLFFIGMLTYMETDFDYHVSIIIASVGIVALVKGIFIMNKDN